MVFFVTLGSFLFVFCARLPLTVELRIGHELLADSVQCGNTVTSCLVSSLALRGHSDLLGGVLLGHFDWLFGRNRGNRCSRLVLGQFRLEGLKFLKELRILLHEHEHDLSLSLHFVSECERRRQVSFCYSLSGEL